MGNVAVDSNGYYFDPDTGADLAITFDESGNFYNAYTGEALQFWGDSGFDGGQITDAVKDVLIAIYGNPQTVASQGRMTRYPGPPVSSGVQIYSTAPARVQASSDGAGIHLSTQTLMLLAGGVLIFLVGQNRGGRR